MLTPTYSERGPQKLSMALELIGIEKFFDDCLAYLIIQDSPSEIDLPYHATLTEEVIELFLSELQGVPTELRDMSSKRVAKFVDSTHWIILNNFPTYFPTSLRISGDYIILNLEELKPKC